MYLSIAYTFWDMIWLAEKVQMPCKVKFREKNVYTVLNSISNLMATLLCHFCGLRSRKCCSHFCMFLIHHDGQQFIILRNQLPLRVVHIDMYLYVLMLWCLNAAEIGRSVLHFTKLIFKQAFTRTVRSLKMLSLFWSLCHNLLPCRCHFFSLTFRTKKHKYVIKFAIHQS